jgi:hypothetical protein
MKPDLVADFTRLCRIGKKVAVGDMSVADVLLNRKPAPRADDGAPRCTRKPHCILVPDHDGGCEVVLDVEGTEVR